MHVESINFAIENPPFPYLTWDESSILKWLKQNDFDLDRLIWRHEDPCIGKTLFKQEILP